MSGPGDAKAIIGAITFKNEKDAFAGLEFERKQYGQSDKAKPINRRKFASGNVVLTLDIKDGSRIFDISYVGQSNVWSRVFYSRPLKNPDHLDWLWNNFESKITDRS